MWPKIKNSFIINLFLLLLAFLTAYGAFNLARQTRVLKEESQRIEERAAKLVLRKQELKRNLAELETREAAERRAKERLNLKLPGEQVVVVVSPASSTVTVSDNQERLSGPALILHQLANFFAKIWASLGF